MAFNPYGFNPYMPAYNGYQTPYLNTPPVMPQAQAQQVAPNQNEPLTNGGFIVVHSEDEVSRYPIAPGNTVTFKIDNQPIIIEKSMSRSQFDSPHYERFKLIKEDMEEPVKNPEVEYAIKTDVDDIKTEVDEIKSNIEKVNERIEKLKGALTKTREQVSVIGGKEDEDI